MNREKEIEKCKKKVCGNDYIKKQRELSKSMVKGLMSHIMNKKDISDEERKRSIKNIKNINKKADIVFKKNKEQLKKECERRYCNPNCKYTVFENGKKLSENTKKKLAEEFKMKKPNRTKKDIDNFLYSLISIRKSIFKNKKSVLKNSFYSKLDKKTVENMKKKGAISGCSLFSKL